MLALSAILNALVERPEELRADDRPAVTGDQTDLWQCVACVPYSTAPVTRVSGVFVLSGTTDSCPPLVVAHPVIITMQGSARVQLQTTNLKNRIR